MEIKVLGCYGGELPGYRVCSFLIDGDLLLDAGTVTSVLSLAKQAQIANILITHTHLDHIKALPFLATNLAGGAFHQPVNIISTPKVIHGIKVHLFNNALWPDFTALPTADRPVIKFIVIDPDVDVQLREATIRAIPVEHKVPAVGYLVRKGKSSVLYTGDTGPTDRLWEEANKTRDLKAVLVETSFPNDQEAIAKKSGHLTPRLLQRELKKLRRKDIFILLAHMKPQFLRQIRKEVGEVKDPRIALLRQGGCYRF
ncbi:MAG: 3',5'-cyclic-nucleotide phosphodiesterase [Deltaproteobacteria bacterium]|nr:3',5'-cyclic-nucleotide phosphodiesterase [Deltaproteobacteria bacterium]